MWEGDFGKRKCGMHTQKINISPNPPHPVKKPETINKKKCKRRVWDLKKITIFAV